MIEKKDSIINTQVLASWSKQFYHQWTQWRSSPNFQLNVDDCWEENFSNTYLLLLLICSSWYFNLSTFILRCFDKENCVGVAVGYCGASTVVSGYGPHYLSDTNGFLRFHFIAVKEWCINISTVVIVSYIN